MQSHLLPIFRTMLETQANLNTLMGGPEWLVATLEDNNGFDYREAVFVEAGEAIGHTNYKWWAKTETNTEQFKMELIDIAHFLLSFTHVVARSAKPYHWYSEPSQPIYTHEDAMVEAWENAIAAAPSRCGIKTARKFLHSLVSNLYGRHTETQVTYTTFDLCAAWQCLFTAILAAFPAYTIQQLLSDYLGKSLLNRFRTVNGAKKVGLAYSVEQAIANPGTYLKVWADGREDNEHLADMIAARVANGTLTSESLYADLEASYKAQFPA